MQLFGRQRAKNPREMSEAERRRRAADAERSALLCLKGGLIRQAEAELRRCVELDPGYAVGHGYLGLILFRLGNLDEAHGELQTALNLSPGDEALRRTQGTILEALGRLESAAREYEAAISLDPKSAWAHAALGGLLLKSGEHAQATGHLLTALALDPQDVQALADLAEVRHKQGDLANAIEALRECIRILSSPGATVALRTGAIGASPGERSEELKSASYQFKLGLLLEEAGDLPGAAVALRAAHGGAATDADILYALGRVLARQGKEADVEHLYERAIKADAAQHTRYQTDLAQLLPLQPGSVAPELERALGLQGVPSPVPAQARQVAAPATTFLNPALAVASPGGSPLGAVAGGVADAIARLEAALTADPNNSRLRRDLSIAYMRAGRLSEAKDQARMAEQLRAQRQG